MENTRLRPRTGFGGETVDRYELSLVPPAALLVCWSEVEPYLKRACGPTSFTTPQGLYEDIVQTQRQLWQVKDIHQNDIPGFLITSVGLSNHTGQRRVEINYGFKLGDREVLTETLVHDTLSQLNRWAELVEADYLMVTGRRGWLKELTKHGFKEDHITYVRPTNGRKQRTSHNH